MPANSRGAVRVFAPGKLYLAGEYAVTEPGGGAIIVAVNRGITVTVAPLPAAAGSSTVTDPVYGAQPCPWQLCGDRVVIADHEYDYVAAALTVMHEARAAAPGSHAAQDPARELAAAELPQDPQHCAIAISSNLQAANGEKYGLGSSGAVVAAVVRALTDFYQLGYSQEQQYRLALLASCTISTAGSGGDIAASIFGGWIRYHAPDRAALAAIHRKQGLQAALTSELWEFGGVTPLRPVPGVELVVGWTGAPVLTDEMLEKAARVRQTPLWPEFVERSNACVARFAAALETAAGVAAAGASAASATDVVAGEAGAADVAVVAELAAAVECAGGALRQLSAAGGFTIETVRLRALRETAAAAGAASKSSGAGGGDCGFALVTNAAQRERILAGWERAQIKHLDLEVYNHEQQ
ncbi:phosphomevalonate kinase [Leucobacter sp. OH2974_COT-288]|nr:phosphomevalonate kinase [Leucobacter sp. OH2974_COT-288]